MNKIDKKNIQKRYLIWFYKVTKEAVDKIERKFTQLEVDRIVAKGMKQALSKNKKPAIKKRLEDFDRYMDKKLKAGNELTSCDEYDFTLAKLQAIEKAIVKMFSKAELNRIKSLYEQEMTERILKSTGH